MKSAFVRYKMDDLGEINIVIVKGEAAESHDAFISIVLDGTETLVTIVDWFEVPEEWHNLVSRGVVNKTFRALLNLDSCSENTPIADLLATIFEAGHRLAEKKRD